MMEIRDRNANVIPACFTFGCYGFEVSCSTITSPSEVVVFRGDDCRKSLYRASNVENAVQWCRYQVEAGMDRGTG